MKGFIWMIDEIITIEQLTRVKRLVELGATDLAVETLAAMIQGREERVARFELEQQAGMNA
jgi:hypothetical protein